MTTAACPQSPLDFFLTLDQQQALYDVVYDTQTVLRAHHILFWATEGTMLGAIRHKGLIPWDDDVDVAIRVEDRPRLDAIPDSVWKKHNLLLRRHWLGFKICRRDGYDVPNSEDWPYKYPFVDVFILEPHGRKWRYARGKNADWEHRASEIWKKEYILNDELFPLHDHVFDFPGGTRTLPVPHHARTYLDRTYKGWHEFVYTNAWNHREERREERVCKYMMPDVLAAEKKFFKPRRGARTALKNNPNAQFLRGYVDHIYIINLEHRADRRDHIRQQMKYLGIPTSQYTFVKATDRSWPSQHAALRQLGFSADQLPAADAAEHPLLQRGNSKDTRLVRNFMVRRSRVQSRIMSHDADLSKRGLAELAVALSHARVWHTFLETAQARRAAQRTPRVLVLEDDACVSATFPQSDLKALITTAAQQMPERELVLLGYCHPHSTYELLRGEYNVLESGQYYCMQSYIITPSIARTMLDHVFPVAYPVDELFQDPELMKRAIVFKFPPFFQSPAEGGTSDIQTAEGIEYELTDTEAQKFGQCYRE